MTTPRCPLCFARDVDVVFLRHDPAREEYYCLQCAYAGSPDEVERLLQTYRETRYKRRAQPHPFARRRTAAETVKPDANQ